MDNSEIASAAEATQDGVRISEESVRQDDRREAARKRQREAEFEEFLKDSRSRKKSIRIIYFVYFNLSLALTYVISEVLGSPVFSELFKSNSGVFALIFCYLCVSAIFYLVPDSPGDSSSFAEIDRRHQESKIEMAKIAENKVDELAEGIAEIFGEAATSLGAESGGSVRYDFEIYLKKIIGELDNQMSLSDEKASKLLDKGVWYLGGGLLFYIGAIFFWQVWAKGEDLSAVVALGMFSCTVAFVVIEFLAAWFLKQYRSFVDSSLSYARVKSHYDRCLLSYYALREFSSSTEDVAVRRAEILEYLKREAHWPDSKQVNENDFNYMLESMNSMSAAADKFRGLFKKPKKV